MEEFDDYGTVSGTGQSAAKKRKKNLFNIYSTLSVLYYLTRAQIYYHQDFFFLWSELVRLIK